VSSNESKSKGEYKGIKKMINYKKKRGGRGKDKGLLDHKGRIGW